MSGPRSPPRADPRAISRLFDALHAEAWDALGHYRLDDADREDLAQDVVIAAYRRWETYREDAGTPRQWIRGIARNEVLMFYRRRGKMPSSVGDEELLGAADVATVEETVAMHDLTEQLLAQVPPRQRWFVILHQMFGLTFREIAKKEGISLSRTYAHYEAGMKALEAAVEQWKKEQARLGLVPLPLTTAAFFAAHDVAAPPPPDVVERAWRRVAGELGLDDEIAAPPPSSRPPVGGVPWLRKLGGIKWAVLGVLGGVLLCQCTWNKDPGRCAEVAPLTMAAAIPPAGAPPPPLAQTSVLTECTTPVPLPSPSTAPPMPSSAPPAIPARPVPCRKIDDDREAMREQALIDRGRVALETGHLESALDVLTEHAERFPQGRHAAARKMLWSEACAWIRKGNGAPDARCAQGR